MKLLSDPTPTCAHHTFDLEVGESGNDKATHSYQIVFENGKNLVTHNTVSLLAGATPGVHFPLSLCYIRRVRLSKDSDLIPALINAGFNVEPAVGSEKSTVVVEFPVKLEKGVKSQYDVSMWEKLELTAFMQEHWADNQVSVTIDFDPKKEGNDISSALEYFQYRLKSVSFLPRSSSGEETTYPQMPYENISEERYDEMAAKLRPIRFPRRATDNNALEDKVEKDIFCDSDKCVVIDNHRNSSLRKSDGGANSGIAEKRNSEDSNQSGKKQK